MTPVIPTKVKAKAKRGCVLPGNTLHAKAKLKTETEEHTL